MIKKYVAKLLTAVSALTLLVPAAVWASGDKASALIVVADTRRVSSAIERYFADAYNTDPLMFAVYAVILTAVYGVFLGVFMDFLMSRTGLDLTSRKIVEH
jgi:ABC-type Fe3+ transport system permease subunit